MDRRVAVALAVVVLAVGTAGCALPGSEAPGTDTGETLDSTTPNESTEGNESDALAAGDTWNSIAEDRLYNRTAALVGSDAPPPEVRLRSFDFDIPAGGRPVFEYLGLRDPDAEVVEGSVLGLAVGPDTVEINETFATMNRSERSTDASLRFVLVHEFAHTIQSEEGWTRPDWSDEIPAERGSIERRLLSRALTEGGAVYAADAFADSVGADHSQIERYERRYRTGASNETYLLAPYHHGGQYFRAVVDSPASYADVYETDPPRTTTELLHPNRTDFEPRPLNVTTTVRHEGWRVARDGRAGELFAHVTVAAHLDTDRADEAATGYAGDQLVTFEGENGTGYVWVTHWRTGEDATEFAGALTETLAVRDDEQTDAVGVRRRGDRRVVVAIGPDGLRRNISVEGSIEGVRLTSSHG